MSCFKRFLSYRAIVLNVIYPKILKFRILRPTLMGTKNLYENGPDPFFV